MQAKHSGCCRDFALTDINQETQYFKRDDINLFLCHDQSGAIYIKKMGTALYYIENYR
jgi:hypothetical protein